MWTAKTFLYLVLWVFNKHHNKLHSYVFQADLDQQLDAALELMRRLPPQKSEKNLSDIIDLVPELCEDLLASVDQPLKVLKCTETGKNFLLCDYNRDGDSYRLASISSFLLFSLCNLVLEYLECFSIIFLFSRLHYYSNSDSLNFFIANFNIFVLLFISL